MMLWQCKKVLRKALRKLIVFYISFVSAQSNSFLNQGSPPQAEWVIGSAGERKTNSSVYPLIKRYYSITIHIYCIKHQLQKKKKTIASTSSFLSTAVCLLDKGEWPRLFLDSHFAFRTKSEILHNQWGHFGLCQLSQNLFVLIAEKRKEPCVIKAYTWKHWSFL